ncbi:MAG: hypothetical protein HZB87_12495, partial [Desulfatitalea sp.]|nr:hypothetical protein [Desulfatitalea sp.]
YFILNGLKPIASQRNFPEALFNTDFPQTGGAEKKSVSRVQKSFPGGVAEAVIVRNHPKKAMGIQ